MSKLRAVLFDWRGTLVVAPSYSAWIRQALRNIGRGSGDAAVDVIRIGLRRAIAVDDIGRDWERTDTSAALHRRTYRRMFAEAGLDAQLADELYRLESDPFAEPLAEDAVATLTALHSAGIAIAVVSDIHFDLRPRCTAAGLGEVIDSYVLSFEHGVQKPDPEMFELALADLGVSAEHALMVGDRATHDGAAIDTGITTLLLPPLTRSSDRRLQRVLQACGIHPAARGRDDSAAR